MSENLFPLLTKLLKVSSKLKQTKIPEERRSATLDLFVKSVLSNENETRKHEGMPLPERCLHQHISFICVKSYCCEYEPTSQSNLISPSWSVISKTYGTASSLWKDKHLPNRERYSTTNKSS